MELRRDALLGPKREARQRDPAPGFAAVSSGEEAAQVIQIAVQTAVTLGLPGLFDPRGERHGGARAHAGTRLQRKPSIPGGKLPAEGHSRDGGTRVIHPRLEPAGGWIGRQVAPADVDLDHPSEHVRPVQHR